MTTANRITLLRIAMTIAMVAIYYLVPGDAGLIATTVVFLLAALTDALDGYLARARGQVTSFGKLMDPIADKLLMCAALLILLEAGALSVWAAFIFLGREFIVNGFRLVVASQSQTVISANMWGKLKTVAQDAMIVTMLLAPVLPAAFGIIGQVLLWAAIGLTIVSAVVYLAQNWRLLGDNVFGG